MVQTGIMRGCGSSWCPGGVKTFHAFPKNSIRRKLWLGIVPMRMRFYESARICNLHFEESDFDATGRLNETAVHKKIIYQEAVSPDKISSKNHVPAKIVKGVQVNDNFTDNFNK